MSYKDLPKRGFFHGLWHDFKVYMLDYCPCGGKWKYHSEYGYGEHATVVEQCTRCREQRTYATDYM